MVTRPKFQDKADDGGSYLASPKSSMQFIPSGCVKLDCDLGGGWPLGKVSNVVGDASTGKTLVGIEAGANFIRNFDGYVDFNEAEGAFDTPYAESLGVDMRRFKVKSVDTVEDVERRIDRRINLCLQKNVPGLIIWDSVDATTDKAEQKQGFDEGSYGGAKPKQIGKMFRQHVRGLREANIHLMCISQTRDKIGVTFGEKKTRSGGKSLQFYASQVVWLAYLGQVSRTINKIKRTTGVQIRAKSKKNKIGLQFRESDFNIEFGFGIDDLTASVNWLDEIKRLDDADLGISAEKFLLSARKFDSAEYRDACARLGKVVRKVWREVETSFLPTRKKY